jgi:hypothetical protein
LSGVAAKRGAQKTSRRSISPLDQSGKLELADLPLLRRLWPPCPDQTVHLFFHRLAFPSPVLELVIDHRTLPVTQCYRENPSKTKRALTPALPGQCRQTPGPPDLTSKGHVSSNPDQVVAHKFCRISCRCDKMVSAPVIRPADVRLTRKRQPLANSCSAINTAKGVPTAATHDADALAGERELVEPAVITGPCFEWTCLAGAPEPAHNVAVGIENAHAAPRQMPGLFACGSFAQKRSWLKDGRGRRSLVVENRRHEGFHVHGPK